MAVCASCGSDNAGQARFCSTCGHRLTSTVAEPRETRRTVTVLFADIVDSTGLGERLDPEFLNRVLSGFYDRARHALERHGGTVEKYIGDAVVGFFGIPTLHEDDALRAVRAALELRGTLTQLNYDLEREFGLHLSLRTAVNTGEVVVSSPAGVADPAVLGDTLNVADRLQRSAGTDEILIGHATYRLVSHHAVVEQVSPLSLKGKEVAVTAWRLLALEPGRDLSLRLAAPFVGRELELNLLHSFIARAVEEARCHLVTVIGEAGVGKTRLLHEFNRQAGENAIVLFGRCRPYGDDITFWPLAEIIRRAVGIRPSDPLSVAEARLDEAFADAGERVVTRIAQLLGLRRASVEPGDTYWALRRALEVLAAQRPLVGVIDDLHAGQPSLLEFIEFVTASCRTPILLVCLARPEFLDDRRDWGGGKSNALTLQLTPLSQRNTERLVESLLDEGEILPDLRTRIANAAGGNPFFAEELVANLLEEKMLGLDDGHWVVAGNLTAVPATPRVEAVLAARLDRLGPVEQAIIERASVIGEQFRAAEIAALLRNPDRKLPAVEPAEVEAGLLRLVQEELLRSDSVPGPPGSGESLFSFRHELIRDAAYHRILKGERALHHERHADWLEQVGMEQVWTIHLDEIVGRHLREAYRYRMELGWLDDATRALGRRAGTRLAIAGRRAVLQGDAAPAAAELLTDAIQLLAENDEVRRDALLDLAVARRDAGQLERALSTYEEVLAGATAADDRHRATQAVLGRLIVLSDYDLEGLLRDGPAQIEQAIKVLEQLEGDGDPLNLARAWRLRALIHWARGKLMLAATEAEQAIRYADSAHGERLEESCRRLRCFIFFWGPEPLDKVVEYCEETRALARRRGIRLEKHTLAILAQAAAMQGDFNRAHKFLDAARDLEAGEPFFRPANILSEASVNLLEGRPAEAIHVLNERAAGHAISLAMLARALTLVGRDEEAERATQECEGVAAPRQLDAQIKWRGIRAVALAHQDRLDDAERFAREAVEFARLSEQPDSKAQALADLAEVLKIASRPVEAVPLMEQALGLYLHKGNAVMAERTRRSLATLRSQGTQGTQGTA